MIYLDLLADFAVNLVAICLLTFAVYYRRHRRRDLVLAYIALNVGLFVVVAMLSLTPVDLALGFGLFAILSIIRLRSDAISQEEVAYYFMALALGLLNGLRIPDLGMTLMLNALLVLVVFVADHRRLLARTQRRQLTLEVIIDEPALLVAELGARVRGRVVHHTVTEVDYVRDVMVIDVRYVDLPDRAAADRNSTGRPLRSAAGPRVNDPLADASVPGGR